MIDTKNVNNGEKPCFMRKKAGFFFCNVKFLHAECR